MILSKVNRIVIDICVQPHMWRRQLSVDISCPQGAQQQTRRTPLLLSIDGTQRRT